VWELPVQQAWDVPPTHDQKKARMNRSIHSAYRDLLGYMPNRSGKALLRTVWKNRGHPSIFIDPRQHRLDGLGKGSVTFSLDFELAWAWRFSKGPGIDCTRIGMWERAYLPRVLSEFDWRGIPATWAIVGHLLLPGCRRRHDGVAHPEIPHIAPFETQWWRFDGPDWFANDPCSDAAASPAWYAPDLFALIRDSPVGHEIASHTFSHMGVGPYCSHEVAVAELAATRNIMRANGVEVETFIHPANDLGNFAALVETGHSIYREYPSLDREISLPVRRPDGLWKVPSAGCVTQGRETDRHRLSVQRRRLEVQIDAAVATGLNAHFWLHPSILPAQAEYVLFPILDYCARLRDRGNLDVYTMKDLVRATRSLSPSRREREFDVHAA
jgi:peptidoglycan/xylan/chitin deacetylase (PgdA/CDA1 family)